MSTTPEAAREIKERDKFQNACLLVPIVMKLLLNDSAQIFEKWGQDRYWLALMFQKVGIVQDQLTEVGQVIDAGKFEVWGQGKNELGLTVKRAMDLSGNDIRQVEVWRRHWTSLAIKMTVMAASDSSDEKYERNMTMVRFLKNEPEVTEELMSQLGIYLNDQEKTDLIKWFKTIDLD